MLSMGQIPLTAGLRQYMTREEADECIAESFGSREDAFEYHVAEIAKICSRETMSAELDRMRIIAKLIAEDKLATGSVSICDSSKSDFVRKPN